MTNQVTFLHTGDLHIGAPVRYLRALDAVWEKRMERVIMESYERLIREALDRQVDFVVMAGDCFDTSKCSYGDFKRFFDGLHRLDKAGIPTYLVAGNHDPYTSWSNDLDLLPPSAHMMGVGAPTFKLFSRKEEPLVMLGARSYYNQTWPQDKDISEGISREAAILALSQHYPALDMEEVPFMVGIIHTGLHLDPNKAPTNESDLYIRGVDYWACAHLHNRTILPSYENPRIVFPGDIQGRALGETGPRGCFQVTLSMDLLDGQVQLPAMSSIEFVPTASVVMNKLVVDTSTLSTLADLSLSIQTELFHANGQAHCEDMVVTITLTGETELYPFLLQPQVIEQLRRRVNDIYPNFFCDALINRTRPLDFSQRTQADGMVPSLVRDMADQQRKRDDEMMNFLQSELVKRGISVPDSLLQRLPESENQAELLLLNLLGEEDS